MKRRALFIGVLGVLVALAALYLWGPSKAPPGQELLLALTGSNFSEFEAAFDKAADSPRLVLLLSPT